MIDLRSDTVTKPTADMRAAIMAAEVGDDVIGLDPTIRRLEERIAGLLGKEAALFMPSGTMTNQIAIRLHCQPGDEFICEEGSHVYNYEQGAYAQLSGLATRTITGRRGVLQLDQLRGMIRPDDDHNVRTRLVCLENTHNRGGGSIQPLPVVAEICSWASEHGLRRHLDGARLFNAVVASGIEAKAWCQHFDSVSVCFSKGLGAPVGSALAGDSDFIRQARRQRKLFGGGMRQAGVIAAGALFALDHHIDRLEEDHQNARCIADAIRDANGLTMIDDQVDTNIIMFRVEGDENAAQRFLALLEQQDIHALSLGPKSIRMVTHLDVSRSQAETAAEQIRTLAASFAGHANAGHT